MQGAGPVSPREGYLVDCGAGCPHECHPHPAVTAAGWLCAYSLGTIVLNLCIVMPQEEAYGGQDTEG